MDRKEIFQKIVNNETMLNKRMNQMCSCNRTDCKSYITIDGKKHGKCNSLWTNIDYELGFACPFYKNAKTGKGDNHSSPVQLNRKQELVLAEWKAIKDGRKKYDK